jgi:cytochrome c oxidase subunit 2
VALRLPDFLTPPAQGSELAAGVDRLFGFTVLYATFFSVLIAALLFHLGWKYRRGAPTPPPGEGSMPVSAKTLEIVWAVVPLALVLFTFAWGAEVFLALSRPPAGADEYFVVARQWMWKVQHPEGPREINELHAPVGRAIKLTMTSEDVIHSFFVPAFRIKSDVLPGRYTTVWFRASRPGTHHLFCAEYCGTEHSKMIGRVVVMEPFEYEQWLSGRRDEQPPAASGEALFRARGCATCHRPDSAARAPVLNGLFGRTVTLADGSSVTADEGYLRESILRPAAKIVRGYPPVMPAYEGQISEEEVMLLIAHLRSLGAEGGAAR